LAYPGRFSDIQIQNRDPNGNLGNRFQKEISIKVMKIVRYKEGFVDNFQGVNATVVYKPDSEIIAR